jgi:hypothetical protein
MADKSFGGASCGRVGVRGALKVCSDYCKGELYHDQNGLLRTLVAHGVVCTLRARMAKAQSGQDVLGSPLRLERGLLVGPQRWVQIHADRCR